MNERTYQIGVSWNEEILVITLSGQASEHNAAEIVREVIGIANEKRPRRVLVDSRNLRGQPGFADTYFLAREYPLQDAYITPRIAVINREENRSLASFRETTTWNLGLNIRYFSDPDEAIVWLRA